MLSPAGQGSSDPLTQDFSYEEKVAFERLKFNKGLNSQQAYEVIIAARGAAPPAAVTDTPSGGISLGPPPAVGPAADEAPAIDPLAKAVYAPLPAAPSAEEMLGLTGREKSIIQQALEANPRDFADTTLTEISPPLSGYGPEADEIFARRNIRSGTELGQYLSSDDLTGPSSVAEEAAPAGERS